MRTRNQIFKIQKYKFLKYLWKVSLDKNYQKMYFIQKATRKKNESLSILTNELKSIVHYNSLFSLLTSKLLP